MESGIDTEELLKQRNELKDELQTLEKESSKKIDKLEKDLAKT